MPFESRGFSLEEVALLATSGRKMDAKFFNALEELGLRRSCSPGLLFGFHLAQLHPRQVKSSYSNRPRSCFRHTFHMCRPKEQGVQQGPRPENADIGVKQEVRAGCWLQNLWPGYSHWRGRVSYVPKGLCEAQAWPTMLCLPTFLPRNH